MNKICRPLSARQFARASALLLSSTALAACDPSARLEPGADATAQRPSALPASSAERPVAPVATSAPIAAAEVTPAANEYLSKQWAKKQSLTNGNSPAEAEELRKAGYALYKTKNDVRALGKYEAALDLHATGRLYYDYANSLSNVDGRLEDAVAAYDRAVELGYDKRHIALYNKACALSRMGNSAAAIDALKTAVDAGYRSFERMKTDPELAKARTDARFSELFLSWTDAVTALGGYLTVPGGGFAIGGVYVICPDGEVFENRRGASDGSCCEQQRRGRLTQDAGIVAIEWTELCERHGEGATTRTRSKLGGALCNQHAGGCTAEERCVPTSERTPLLPEADLPKVRQNAAAGRFRHRSFNGVLAVQCKPDQASDDAFPPTKVTGCGGHPPSIPEKYEDLYVRASEITCKDGRARAVMVSAKIGWNFEDLAFYYKKVGDEWVPDGVYAGGGED